MKHITYADKSLLVDDEAADIITEYAAALARNGSADTVTLAAYGQDGDEVEATFVLGSGTVLMSESTHSSIVPPDNSEAVAGMREKLRLLETPSSAMPDQDGAGVGDGSDFDEL